LKRYVHELGGGFAVLETLGDYSQGQSLDARDGFVAIMAVGQDAGQFWNFSEPPAVVFLLDLNGERHRGNVPSAPAVNKSPQPTSGSAAGVSGIHPAGYYAFYFKDLEGIKYEVVTTERNEAISVPEPQ